MRTLKQKLARTRPCFVVFKRVIHATKPLIKQNPHNELWSKYGKMAGSLGPVYSGVHEYILLYRSSTRFIHPTEYTKQALRPTYTTVINCIPTCRKPVHDRQQGSSIHLGSGKKPLTVSVFSTENPKLYRTSIRLLYRVKA